VLKLTTDKHEASCGLCDSRASCKTFLRSIHVASLTTVNIVMMINDFLLVPFIVG